MAHCCDAAFSIENLPKVDKRPNQSNEFLSCLPPRPSLGFAGSNSSFVLERIPAVYEDACGVPIGMAGIKSMEARLNDG